MQIVLVVAAVVSVLIGEWGTAIGLAVLTLFNAWLGYHQEGQAQAAAAALGAMMKAVAKVRRDGEVAEVPADQIVPGDVVLVDAGDRIPADGRVVVAATALLIPSQVLWIHMAIVAPIGAVMGLDVGTPGIMRRKPRPFNEPIIVRSMMVRLFVAGLFMATATLILVQVGKSTYQSLEVGQTMAVVGLGLMNIFLALNLRFPEDSAFGSATFSNPKLLRAFAWAVIGSMLITQLRVLQDLFHTTPLTGSQWALCLVPGLILLAGGELLKIILRSRRRAAQPAVAAALAT